LRYVLDCSVVVRWFVPQIHFERAVEIFGAFQARAVDLVAPEVIIAEFGHVLRKLVVGASLDPEQAPADLDTFLTLPIAMVADRELAAEALRLALRYSATFYDSLYVALAIREDLKVITADKAMCAAFESLGRTLWLPDYR
jgi:predicted nucleic acid-binding protein